MSTLTKKEILERLKSEAKTRLIVTPLLHGKQVGDASIDVRLGNQFILFKMHNLETFGPDGKNSNPRLGQERQVFQYGEHFILHPGMLALGATLEYLSMPCDLECQVEGRSSWARVGLQVATASSVEPGFKGCVTLELSNVGTLPLKLYPGLRIAQLVFRTAHPPITCSLDGRKYHLSIGPKFSSIHTDKDSKVFLK